MPVTDMMMDGVSLMFIGMGIVFIFLTVLVFAMKGMSRLAILLGERQGSAEASTHTNAGTAPGQGNLRGDLIAVISAAVSRYRATHG